MSYPIEEDTTLFPKKSRYIKTDKPRPFRCNICTRGFVRQEHLKRHQVSHTRERPYLCVLCGRCFARKDLILRHQNKLHPTFNNQSTTNNNNKPNLFDNSLQEDLNQLNPDLKQDNIENGILKIVGNTETILPIGSGKDIRRKKLSKKRTQKFPSALQSFNGSKTVNSTSDLYANTTLRRSHSFSARSAHSYTKNGNIESDSIQPLSIKPTRIQTTKIQSNTVTDTSNKTTNTTINNSVSENVISSDLTPSSNLQQREQSQIHTEISSEIGPNEVEFQTTHLNNQQLPHKVDQYWMLDQDPSSTLSMNMTYMNSATSQPLVYNHNNVTGNINYTHNIDFHHNNMANINDGIQPLYPNTTVHLDTLSVGPINNGSMNQNIPTVMNLNTFEYPSNDLNPSTSYLSYNQMQFRANSNMKATTTNSATTELQSNFSNTNGTFHSTAPTTVTNTITTETEDPFEDPWINRLLTDTPIMKFKVDPKNFNNIGFDPSLSSRSGSLSASSCSSDIPESSTNKNSKGEQKLSSNLSNGISAYFTSRQLDIFEAQKELLKSQQEISTVHPNTHNSNINPNLVSLNSVSNFNHDNNINRIINNGEDERLRVNFDAKQASTKVSASSSMTNPTQASINSNLNNISQYTVDPHMVPVLSGKGLNVGNYTIFDDRLRNFIIQENKLSDNIFPTVNQLNDYINLYQLEFGVFIPFIHIFSIKPSQENYPLLTALAMIGALYSFRSSHTKILSNVTMSQLTRQLQKLQNGSYNVHNDGGNPLIPIWILQAMTLVNILGVFNNSGKVMREMNTYIMSLINLVLKYNVNLPLEQFLELPEISFPPTEKQITSMFKYFILSQERIRLCHMLLLLSNVFASLVGLQSGFHSIDLKCGVPTIYEDLFECSDPAQWYQTLQRRALTINSKFSLIQLANGNQLYENCLSYLSRGDPFFFQNAKLSKLTMLSLLVSIHEKISMERSNCISQLLINTNGNGETMSKKVTLPRIDQYWRTYCRPSIEMIIQYWEKLFINNGGILDINAITIPMIDRDPLIRIIIPYYIFAKMRLCLDLSYVMNRIWLKDWTNMNILLDEISYDWNTLHETTEYCIYIIESWISILIGVKKIPSRKFTEEGGYRTPITTITILFAAVCILSEYLKRVEAWAKNIASRNGQAVMLESVDRTFYLKAFMTLKKVQNELLSSKKSMKSYLEFLRIQTKQHFNSLSELDDANEINLVTAPNATAEQLAKLINKLNLSSRALYLGVRILGDSPVWPIVMVFAHALQSRAIFNVSSGQHV